MMRKNESDEERQDCNYGERERLARDEDLKQQKRRSELNKRQRFQAQGSKAEEMKSKQSHIDRQARRGYFTGITLGLTTRSRYSIGS